MELLTDFSFTALQNDWLTQNNKKNQQYFTGGAKSTMTPIAPITIHCSAFSSSGYPLTPPPCTWIVNRGIKGRVVKGRNRHTIDPPAESVSRRWRPTRRRRRQRHGRRRRLRPSGSQGQGQGQRQGQGCLDRSTTVVRRRTRRRLASATHDSSQAYSAQWF